jgi:hypothetical protein
MGAYEFGRYVDRVIRERGLSQPRVSVMVGTLEDGRILNEKGVDRIREGGRRLDPILVQRLIDVLGLDPALAWSAAGIWPPDLSPEEYREFRDRPPRQPALAHAVGGQRPPRQESLRPDQNDQQGAVNAPWPNRAGHRWWAEMTQTGQAAA